MVLDIIPGLQIAMKILKGEDDEYCPPHVGLLLYKKKSSKCLKKSWLLNKNGVAP